MERERKKARRQCYISAIPDYMLVSLIFVRLPARSVVAVRSVCKSWRSLTSSPSFVVTHARLARTSIVFESKTFRRNHALFHMNLTSEQYTKRVVVEKTTIPGKLMEHDTVRLLASCDGLLCLEGVYSWDHYVVCNPVTKDWLNVPRFGNGLSQIIISFFFHHPTGEYRLLRQYSIGPDATGYEVFGIGGSNKVWRRIDASPGSSGGYRCVLRYPLQRIFVYGSVHWLPGLDDTWIVAFDTNSEEFRRMSISRLIRQGYRHDLVDMGGSLGFWQENKDEMDIWCLKDYVNEEWTKLHTVSLHDIRPVCASLAIWDDGKVLLLKLDNSCFVLYDLESDTLMKQRIYKESGRFWNCSLVHHTESLVSLDSLKERRDTYHH